MLATWDRPIFAVRDTVSDLKSSRPDDRGGRDWLNKEVSDDPVTLSAGGMTTKALNKPPSYFNILFVHPLFGPTTGWGAPMHHEADKGAATGMRIRKMNDALPPVNSVPGSEVPPSFRNQAMQNAGFLQDGLPQWQRLGPGACALHDGVYQAERVRPFDHAYPSSPSMHCKPTPALADMPNYRASTTAVHPSTDPRLRLPPHTAQRTEIEARLYGSQVSKARSGTRSSATNSSLFSQGLAHSSHGHTGR